MSFISARRLYDTNVRLRVPHNHPPSNKHTSSPPSTNHPVLMTHSNIPDLLSECHAIPTSLLTRLNRFQLDLSEACPGLRNDINTSMAYNISSEHEPLFPLEPLSSTFSRDNKGRDYNHNYT